MAGVSDRSRASPHQDESPTHPAAAPPTVRNYPCNRGTTLSRQGGGGVCAARPTRVQTPTPAVPRRLGPTSLRAGSLRARPTPSASALRLGTLLAAADLNTPTRARGPEGRSRRRTLVFVQDRALTALTQNCSRVINDLPGPALGLDPPRLEPGATHR